jgi:hypothetical protein
MNSPALKSPCATMYTTAPPSAIGSKLKIASQDQPEVRERRVRDDALRIVLHERASAP